MNNLQKTNPNNFSLGEKLQLLRLMLTGRSPLYILEKMSPENLINVLNYVWEKSLEIGIRVKGENFSQTDLIKHLKPIERYKSEKKCKEPLQRCEANDCVRQNPDCVKNKIGQQIVALYDTVADYLDIEFFR